MGRNGLLLGLVLIVLGLGLWAWGPGTDDVAPLEPTLQGSAAATQGAGAPQQPTLEPESADPGFVPVVGGREDSPEPAEPGPRATDLRRLQMVDQATGAPLQGIGAYEGDQLLAGPSGPDGWLQFSPPPGRRTTFWGMGWTPREFRMRALPEERVPLQRADAGLEVLLDELAPGDGARNSRLEPLDWIATPEDAWAGTLAIVAPHRLIGEQLAPGNYQLYVWVGPERDPGLPQRPIEVSLQPGRTEVVRLDMSVEPDDKTFEESGFEPDS